MLQVDKNSVDQVFAIWSMFICLVVSGLYFSAFVNPERNSVTRWIYSHLARRALLFSPRTASLVIAIGALLIAIMCVIAAF